MPSKESRLFFKKNHIELLEMVGYTGIGAITVIQGNI